MSFDAEWFGDCANTFWEEQKQLVYAPRMGLVADWGGAHPPSFNTGAETIADIGGGPASLLLKHAVLDRAVVVDPGEYPAWVGDRYAAHGIVLARRRGEDYDYSGLDEAWIYNTLQHVDDPERIVRSALSAKTVRLFEWIDIQPYDGHPHMLTRALLEEWLGARGYVADLNDNGCAVGRCFYGVFLGAGR